MKDTSIFTGILPVYKPVDKTSNAVVQTVKRIFKTRLQTKIKLGHTGTLDPFAEGLLVLCFGRATKIADYLTDAKKSYRAWLSLGQETDTQDRTGKIIQSLPTERYSESQIQEVLHSFLGKSMQTPPAFSALKHQGKPLYEFARKGEMIEKPPREICIERMELLDYKPEQRNPAIQFEVSCSKGTYIRTLGVEIAKKLGTCGHLTALTRTSVGDFSLQNAFKIEILENSETPEKFLSSPDIALKKLPEMQVSSLQKERLELGQKISLGEFPEKVLDRIQKEIHNSVFRVYKEETKEFFGIGEILTDRKILKMKTLI